MDDCNAISVFWIPSNSLILIIVCFRLYSTQVDDASDIDWDMVAQTVG